MQNSNNGNNNNNNYNGSNNNNPSGSIPCKGYMASLHNPTKNLLNVPIVLHLMLYATVVTSMATSKRCAKSLLVQNPSPSSDTHTTIEVDVIIESEQNGLASDTSYIFVLNSIIHGKKPAAVEAIPHME